MSIFLSRVIRFVRIYQNILEEVMIPTNRPVDWMATVASRHNLVNELLKGSPLVHCKAGCGHALLEPIFFENIHSVNKIAVICRYGNERKPAKQNRTPIPLLVRKAPTHAAQEVYYDIKKQYACLKGIKYTYEK